MKPLYIRLPVLMASAFAAAAIALPAAAAERAREGMGAVGANSVVMQVGSNPDNDIKTTVIWMFVGISLAAVTLGVFYLFKRRIGAFPKNPTWVAPITIMRSEDLPGDVETHESTPPTVGQDDVHGLPHQEHAASH